MYLKAVSLLIMGLICISCPGLSTPKKFEASSSTVHTPSVLVQTLDVCIEKLVQCRVDNYSLTEMCIADQTSLREFETCPGYNDFMHKCQDPE